MDGGAGGGRGTSLPVIPRLHLVTDDEVLERPDFPRQAEAVLACVAESGVSEDRAPGVALHLRGPRSSGAHLFHLASLLLPRAREAGVLLLVNDRVDVALTAGADGVHLGTRSLPPSVARGLLPRGALVGASVHGADEVRALASSPPDFLFVGALYPTASHPGQSPGGVERLHEVAAAAGGIPLLAIGGITPERVAEVRAAGAHGVAVLGAVWSREDPVEGLRGFLRVPV